MDKQSQDSTDSLPWQEDESEDQSEDYEFPRQVNGEWVLPDSGDWEIRPGASWPTCTRVLMPNGKPFPLAAPGHPITRSLGQVSVFRVPPRITELLTASAPSTDASGPTSPRTSARPTSE
jgi:hypothetical protein